MKKEKILKFLESAGRTSEEIFAFLAGGSNLYRGGLSGGVRAVSSLKKERWKLDYAGEYIREEKIRHRRIMQMLRGDGLIKSARDGRSANYSITNKGKRWLVDKSKIAASALPRGVYPKEVSDRVAIVVYDVPHARRRYRDWLRGELIGIGLEMLQRSVFIGKVKIPEQLINDLLRLKLIDYVEIFEITKRGTLRSAKQH